MPFLVYVLSAFTLAGVLILTYAGLFLYEDEERRVTEPPRKGRRAPSVSQAAIGI